MTEAEILATTYFDVMDVFRPRKVIVEGESKFLKGLDGEKIYSDIPCSLSSSPGGTLEKGEVTLTNSGSYVVFCKPDIVIKVNDFIELTVKVPGTTKKYSLTAGKARLYPSYLSIPVREETLA